MADDRLILVTRPQDDAAPLLAALHASGHATLAEPLLRIEPVEADAAELSDDLVGVQGLLFTSANGVRAFAAASAWRGLPAFAVGDATATAARAAGFAQVISAAGDVEALAALAAARCRPADGALLHVAGSVTAGDLAGRLQEHGFTVRRRVLYRAVPATALSADCVAAIREGRVAAALFFSPRTATAFVTLAEAAGVASACRTVAALCLSRAVADAAAKIEWGNVRVAARPDQAALLELVDAPQTRAAALQPEPMPAPQEASRAEAMTDRDDVQPEPETPGTAATDDATDDKASQDAQTGDAQTGDAHDEERARALRTIEAFGGIRPMATKLGISFTTVQGWKERGHIPEARWSMIVEKAAELGIDLDGGPEGTPAPTAAPVVVPEPPRPESSASEAPQQKSSEPETPAAPPRPAAETAPPPQPAASPSRAQDFVATPPAPASAWLPALVWVAVFVVGIAVLGAVSKSLWQPWLVAGLSDDTSAGELQALEARVAGLEAVMEAAGGSDAGALAQLRETVERLGGTVSSTAEQVNALAAERPDTDAGARRFEELSGRITALESQLAEGRVTSPGGADLTALTERVAELETGREALDDMAALTERLDAVASRTDALAQSMADAGDGQTAVSDLEVRLAALEAAKPDSRLDSIESKLTAVEQQAAAAQQQASAAEQQAAAVADRAGAMDTAESQHTALVLAVGQLQQALGGSAPFADRLGRVAALSGEDPAIDDAVATLQPHAGNGIPTRNALTERFATLAPEIVRASLRREDGTWVDEAKARIASLISIRPTGRDAGGETAGAIVARAEAKLADGDLAGAVAELDALQGYAAETVADWLAAAKARLAADSAIAGMSERALDRLRAATGAQDG